MRNGEIFWKYFEFTGMIGAYLIFREITKPVEPVSYYIPTFKRRSKLG